MNPFSGKYNKEKAYQAYLQYKREEVTLEIALLPALPIVKRVTSRKFWGYTGTTTLDDIQSAGVLEIIQRYRSETAEIPQDIATYSKSLWWWTYSGCLKGLRQATHQTFVGIPQWWNGEVMGEQEKKVLLQQRIEAACLAVLRNSRFPEHDQLLSLLLKHLKTSKRPKVGVLATFFKIGQENLAFLWQYAGIQLRRELRLTHGSA